MHNTFGETYSSQASSMACRQTYEHICHICVRQRLEIVRQKVQKFESTVFSQQNRLNQPGRVFSIC